MAQLVCVQEHSVKTNLLNQYIKTDKDILRYRQSILNGANVFKFDQVFGTKTNQERIYNQVCKQNILKCMDGMSISFFFIGPKGGGKKHTFRGGENEERGCIMNASEELINLVTIAKSGYQKKQTIKQISPKSDTGDNYQLFVEVFTVNNNAVIDLLEQSKPTSINSKMNSRSSSRNRKKSQNIRNNSQASDDDEDYGLTKLELKLPMEFRSIFRLAINQLIQLSQGTQSMMDNAHLFVRFSIHRNRHILSRATFIKVADFKQSNDPDMGMLTNYLQDISTRKTGRLLSNPHYTNNKLIRCLIESLNRLDDNCAVIINNVSTYPLSFANSIESLAYCTKLKQSLDQLIEKSVASGETMGPVVQNEENNIEDLIQISDDLLFKVFQYSKETQGMNEDQFNGWINAQFQQISTLENEIEYCQPSKLLEQKLMKLQEAKQFLNDLQQQQVEGSTDRDFKSLINQYNKSKDQKSNQNIKIDQQAQTSVQVPDYDNIKQSIMERIDRAISKSSRERSNSENHYKDNNKDNSFQFHDEDKENLNNHNIVNKDKFLKNLKQEIEKKNQRLDEYQDVLKFQQKENLKDRELLNIKSNREEEFSQKEQEFKVTVGKYKQKLHKKKQQVEQLKEKLQDVDHEKAKEMKKIQQEKYELEMQHERLQEQFEGEKIKNQEIESLLQKTRQESENVNRRHQSIEENFSEYDRRIHDLQVQIHQEQDDNKELKISNQIMEKKLEDVLLKNEHLQQKFLKLKKKSEEERVSILEEKGQEIIKRHEKQKKLKKDLKDLTRKLSDLTSEGRLLKLENDKLCSQNEELIEYFQNFQQLKSEMQTYLQRSIELEEGLSRETVQVNQLSIEKEQLIEQLSQTSNEIQVTKKNLEQEKLISSQYEQEVKALNLQNNAQQQLFEKIEQQNQFLSEMQHKDFEKLESKVQQITDELIKLRNENAGLLQNEQKSKQQLTQSQKLVEQQKQKLIQNKLTIQQQHEQIEEMNEKVEDIIASHHDQMGVKGNGNDERKRQQFKSTADQTLEFDQSRKTKLQQLLTQDFDEEEDDDDNNHQDQQLQGDYNQQYQDNYEEDDSVDI